MKRIIYTLIISALIFPSISFAHPGRTDSLGCHTCRTNCASWGLSTGEYHCHRSKGVTQPVEPIRSIRNESGIGTTVPAPEYKVPVVNTIKTQPATTTPIVKTTPKSIVTPTSINETKKPSLLKRFFNWLF